MKKAFLLLASIGMIAAGASAQTQRLNRTNSRNQTTKPTVTTVKEAQDVNTKNPDGTLDLSRNPGNGATGVDGTVNDAAHSGQNNSGAIQDQRSNNTTDEVRPVIQTVPATTK